MRGRHVRPRGARRSLQPSLLATGILAALATTGGVVSVVGWTADSTSERFTVRAAEVPRMDPPAARAHARPRLSWRPVRITDDVPVERYVVTRHLGTVAQVACDVPATERPRCVDRYAPAGYRATYTVAARHGEHWTGADSAPSAVVTAPGVAVPISVNGVLIVPGTGGAPVVVGPAPEAAGPSGTPSSPALEPSGGPSAPVVDAPPVVHVPPAPAVIDRPKPDDGTPAAEPDDKDPADKPKPEKEKPDETGGAGTEPDTESGGGPKDTRPGPDLPLPAIAD